jgi:hypothetical protein
MAGFARAVTLTPDPSPAKEIARERGDRLTTRERLMPESIETSGQIAICPTWRWVSLLARSYPALGQPKTEYRKRRTCH